MNTPKYIRFFMILMSLGLLLGGSESAFAEGSVQVGLNQPLYESGDVVSQIYVDILTAGEVINISLAGRLNTDQVSVKIYNPSDELVNTKILTDTEGKVLIDAPFDGPLTTPYKFTTDRTGTWKVLVSNDTQTGYDYQQLKRFDISVTPSTSQNPDPRVAAGRIHSNVWAFYTWKIDEANSSDADVYTLVPGGYTDTEYVWRLDLNHFQGNYYELLANVIGVSSPYSGYSIPISEGSITGNYPIYLGYPAIAKQSPPANPAQLTGIRFIDNAGTDNTISPGATSGTQDSGYFEFTSNVAGAYAITIDTTQDGIYGAGDRLLLGNAVASSNSVAWDGKNAAGTVVGNGTYTAQLMVRLGECHFVAADVETSGGPSADGLTMCQVYPGGSIADDTLVFWDDATYLSATTTLPAGQSCSTSAGHHTWGDFTSTGFGAAKFIDTYVYGKTATAEILGIVVTDNDTPINRPTIDLNSTDSGTDFPATFAAEGGAIAIAAAGTTITDSDSANMSGAIITLSNPQDGDALSINGALPTGITQDVASTAHKIILTGSATKADYATAIMQMQFNNTSANPSLEKRMITVAATDGAGYGNPSVCAITVTDAQNPEISIKQGETTFERGAIYDFGNVGAPSATRTFSINNTGSGTLNLTGSPYVQISGANAGEFAVETQPTSSPIAAGSSGSFTIRFAPGALGPRTAGVTIGNDDNDENPYSFALTGTGTAVSEINVKQGTTTIADGGIYNFGTRAAGTNTDVIFTVENTGAGDLLLSGPILTITGTDASQFSVYQQPGTVITSSSTTTFTIRFSPTSTTSKTATLTVHSNDADEGEYTITLYGNGTVPSVAAPTSANISYFTATLGGTLSSIGSFNVTERGVYWSTTNGFTPPGQGTKVSQIGTWSTTGTFTVNVDTLPFNTTVYFVAFATNGEGTGYSAQASFVTAPPTPLSCSNMPFSYPGSGTYPSDDLKVWSVCPGRAGEHAALTFTQPDMEVDTSDVGNDGRGCYDYVKLFNGQGTASPDLSSYCYQADGATPSNSAADLSLHNTFTSTDASGCLTVLFQSDGGTELTGFTFDIGCRVLTVTKAGTGAGTVTSSPTGISCGTTCSVSFNTNTLVTLTATPASGSTFGGWTGACTGSNPTCQVTIDAAKAVTATFNRQQFNYLLWTR